MRTLALVLVAAASFVVLAEDKKAPAKPTGTWSRGSDGVEIRLSFPKDQAKFTVKLGETTMDIHLQMRDG